LFIFITVDRAQVLIARLPREIAFKKFSDNKMIVKYLEQGQ
jgi:hypothetical protein